MTQPNQDQERVLVAAAEARYLLEHPRLVEAFKSLEGRYITAWRNSQASTPEAREKLYWLITALDEVRAELTRNINAGKLVVEELRQLNASDLRGDVIHGDAPGGSRFVV